MISRLTYRSRQFWNALLSPHKHVTSGIALDNLSPTQLSLFQRMQPAEQAHAYQIFNRLTAAGHANSDLLVAALLHDAGKILHPLSAFDRVVIVLGRHLFRETARRWGDGPIRGLRRPFVVAARHAEWGADLASQAGAAPVTVDLIRRHHDPHLTNPSSTFERILATLQEADDES